MVPALRIPQLVQGQDRDARSGPDRHGVRLVVEPQVGLQRPGQLLPVHRLEQVLDGPDLIAVLQKFLTVGNKEDADLLIPLPQLAGKVHAGLAPHQNIQAQEVEPRACGHCALQRFRAGKGRDLIRNVPLRQNLPAHPAQGFPGKRLVLTYRDLLHPQPPPADAPFLPYRIISPRRKTRVICRAKGWRPTAESLAQGVQCRNKPVKRVQPASLPSSAREQFPVLLGKDFPQTGRKELKLPGHP